MAVRSGCSPWLSACRRARNRNARRTCDPVVVAGHAVGWVNLGGRATC